MSVLHPSLDLDQKETASAIEKAIEDGDAGSRKELARVDRQTVRKLDFLLLPMVCVIYLLGYIDRANVGNARLVSKSNSPLFPRTNLLTSFRLALPKIST